MQGFYNITTAVKNQLLQDDFCNTVTIGDIFNVDLKKQTIFPLSHIIVNSADLENNVWRFNMSVIAMDIVDKSKELETDVFIGNDNEHDVLNTQLAVLNRLLEVLRRGSLSREYYQLDGNPSLEPFTERFENYLAGWTATFDVLIPNTMTACDGITTTVACANGTVTITDDAGNTLYTLSVVSGGSDTQIISDVTVSNSDATYSASVNAEGSLVLPDITVTDSNGSTYTQSSVTDVFCTPCEGVDVYVGEANVGTFPSGSDVFVKVIQDGLEVIPEDITVVDDEVSIILADVPPCPDTNIEVNGVSEGSVPSGSTIDVQLSDSGGTVTPDSVTLVGTDLQIVLPDAVAPTPVGATLMKTGQTTSYRTGDDGDIEAGRDVNFTTLAVNNPFGNTNRFTNELGGQTYTNNIVIDWSTYQGNTVLGWYRTPNATNVVWNVAIDSALTISVGSFTSGWRLPNIMEFCSILNWGLTSYLNYSPFNLGGISLQTSTTWGFTTTNNITLGTTGFPSISVKTNASGRYIGVRTFTVTGTTLT